MEYSRTRKAKVTRQFDFCGNAPRINETCEVIAGLIVLGTNLHPYSNYLGDGHLWSRLRVVTLVGTLSRVV